jgi:hypothetical protein
MQEVEAALKKLRKAGDDEARRRALDRLEAALEKLRDQSRHGHSRAPLLPPRR